MNTINRSTSALLRSCIVGFLLSSLAPLALAQSDDATYVRVFVTTVKSDRVSEFEDLLRQRSEGLDAAGAGFRSVYQSLVGEQFTYLMVDYVPSKAALDGPLAPGAAVPPGWGSRNDAAQSAQTMLLMRRYPELRIPAEEGSERGLVQVRIRRTAPGRTQDYYDWQLNQLLPALREAGVTGVFINRVILGGSAQTWMSFSSLESMSSFDDAVMALAESMGERESEQMIERGAAMLVHTEDLIMRYRSDLSFFNADRL